jgi:hypothetical protein
LRQPIGAVISRKNSTGCRAMNRRRGNPAMVKGGPSINPEGKRAGNRDKICRELLADMNDAWQLYGIKALKEMAASDPTSFVKAYVGLLPKEVKVDATESMSEDQLLARIRELAVNLGVESALLLAGAVKSGETTH